MMMLDIVEGNSSNNNGTESGIESIEKGMVRRLVADVNRKSCSKRGSSASDYRGPKTSDLRKQAQENAAMMKHVYGKQDQDPVHPDSVRPDPIHKEPAEQKPVHTRVRKRENASSSPRPKSWHTEFMGQPDLTKLCPAETRTGNHPAPPTHRNPPVTTGHQFHSASESSFINSSYHHHPCAQSMVNLNNQCAQSMVNLNNNDSQESADPFPGHVQKKREAFERNIMSQSMDRITEEQAEDRAKRMWNEKGIITQGVNPKFRDISLEPAEIYPKIVVGTSIAQSKGIIGKVPENGDQRGQRYGTGQDVSIHTVQMPQRQIASSADSSVTRNYAQSHSKLSNYPQTRCVSSGYPPTAQFQSSSQPVERRVPPAIPKREDSKKWTQAYSEHVKSSSWPATTSTPECTNTVTLSSQTIQPSDLPPVKERRSPPQSQSQPNPNKNSNSTTQEIYKAKPVWFDGTVFNYDKTKVLNTETQFASKTDSACPPSPPTRDTDHVQVRQKPNRSTDERYQTGDHLIQVYKSYLEETEKQEENVRQSMVSDDTLSESSDHQSLLSKTQQIPSATPTRVSQPLAQTMPVGNPNRTWYPDVERQRNTSSVSSQDSVPISETEMNKRNLMGQNSDRTWQNPSDKRDGEWQTNEVTISHKPQPQQQTQPKRSSHSRQSSDIDVNAPRMRSPLGPSLLNSFDVNPKEEERYQQAFSQKIEKAGNCQESRDNRNSGMYEPKVTYEENSILRRLKVESFKNNRPNADRDCSEGNVTSGRKVIAPDTMREKRESDAFKSGKSLHYHSGSFTHDTRGSTNSLVEPRLNQTMPDPSHRRTHSIDAAPNRPSRRESMEQSRVSRENSFSGGNIAERRQFWQQQQQHRSHNKSNSDSDQHPKEKPRPKKNSDPVNRHYTSRKVSDPDNKQHIKDTLDNFVRNKRSPTGSVSSSMGSRQASISGSEVSLSRSEMYPSTSSLISISSSRGHYTQDSTSSFGSFSQPMHHPQDSGFGSNSDISQIRSPHSPPQTGVVSPLDFRMAANLSKQGNNGSISRSASMNHPQSQYYERDRRRSHQPAYHPHQARPHHQRMSLDPDRIRQNQRSPEDRPRLSPTKQMATGQYNVEQKTIARVQEEVLPREGAKYYSRPQEERESRPDVFQFPPSPLPEPSRTTPPKSSTSTSPSGSKRSPPHSATLSPPPPPTPLSPWEGVDEAFPPPPPELAPTTESPGPAPAIRERQSPVMPSPVEGSMPQTITETITATRVAAVKQVPPSTPLEVLIDAEHPVKVEDTTPSLSPNSVLSGRSTPDNDGLPSPQHKPLLPSLQENIPFTNQNQLDNIDSFPTSDQDLTRSDQDLTRSDQDLQRNAQDLTRSDHDLTRSAQEQDRGDAEESEEDESDGDVLLPAGEEEEEAAAQREIEESTDPLLKWVLQSLTPNHWALSDIFPVPTHKRSRSLGGTVKMTHMDVPSPTKSENEAAPEPRSPSECVNLVLSSSRYLRISPAKAIILKRARGMSANDDLGNNNSELRKTQEELVDRISKKVEEIKEMQNEVADEMAKLEELGRGVMERVKAECKASEYNKCNSYIADIQSVTKLLVSLSRKLSKVESVLGSMENSQEEEKVNLEKLKETTHSKYQDAKMLKEGITRRHPAISTMLLNKISNDQHDDFCHYIQMLPRHLIMAQELEDKLTLGNEQLEALRESLKQMSTSSAKDTNGNVHSYKEDGQTSSSMSLSSQEDLNTSATSSYC